MTAVGIVLMGISLTGLVGAWANAANPAPTTTAKATVNSDGTVSVNISGTWVWPGQACSGRYGEGYSVDWWGISSSSTPSPNFTLTNASEVTGPATTTTGSVSPVGAQDIKGSGGIADSFFHIGQYYSGQDINSASTCTDTTFSGQSGGNSTGSTGPWAASATYPSLADLPPNLCVILYDEHGSLGKASGSANDFSPINDNDNSIQTNAFNPAVGQGYCVSLHFQPNVSVVKSGPATGNANGNGTYSMVATNAGTAPAPGVVITDTLPVGETYVSSTDANGTCSLSGSPVSGTSPGVAQTISCPVGTVAANGGTASITVTVSYGANTAGETLVDCADVAGQTNPSCVHTVIFSQSIAGHIYLCSSGSQTTTEVPGGTLAATGPQAVTATANPLAPASVPAGSYVMGATAPAGYEFVTCGGSSTVGTPDTTASDPVTVPVNGSGVGIFYVIPIPNNPAITITVTKTNDANGSGVYAQSEEASAAGENVPFRVVVTNTSTVPVKITALSDSWPSQAPFSPTCATTVVGTTLAPNASATCDFTVDNYAPAAGTSLTNTVNVTGCQVSDTTNCDTVPSTSIVITPPNPGLTVTKTNDANGSGVYAQTETASAAGENVPFRVVVTNTSTVPMQITALSDSWPSQAPFSPTCATALVGTTLAPGASATCDFTVNSYAPAAGSSLTDTISVTGCSTSTSCVTPIATSTVNTPGVPAATAAAQGPAPATAAAGSALPFTGAKLQLLLEIGFGLLSTGSFVLWITRPRRRALVRRS
ncbi:MAG TPA: hypothetical protein VMR97_09840 [Acidimicrobiales bacterium]|nr:hypothetical protein [Acidimicrobiales bacterium]